MSFKTIVAVLERGWRAEQLQVAFKLAADMEAHLVGLHAIRANGIPSYALAEAGPAREMLIGMRKAEIERRENETQSAFMAAAERSGHNKFEWRVVRGDTASAIELNARYADLVIAAQPEGGVDDTGLAIDVHQSLALTTGRPVLVVPYAGHFPAVGRDVLVAWNASRESARAVADSLPFLKRARSVRVVMFNPGPEHGEEPGADIALLLARHGIKVTVATRVAPGMGIGELLLSEAADAGADLIVMGAYGHSRLRELVLGGATRTLLESMTVPVLMSH